MSFIVKQPKGGGNTHVYIVESHHIPKLKQGRQTREYLGVLAMDGCELLLGVRTPEPTPAVLAMLAKRNINYNGRMAGLPGPKTSRARRADGTTAVLIETGRTDALTLMAVEFGLSAALSSAFGAEDGTRLLGLAMHQACESSPSYMAGDWLDGTSFGRRSGSLSASTVSRLLASIGSDIEAQSKFFRLWIDACGKPHALIHDTTSISTHADRLTQAEWGYNRDKESLPQVNLALVCERGGRIPLWYRTIPGSVPDVATLQTTCRIISDLGLADFSLSLDRGYFSETNLAEMTRAKLGFVIGVPMSRAQASALVHKHKAALESAKQSFLHNGARLRHVPCKYEVKLPSGRMKQISAHLYLDTERRELLSRRFETSVIELEMKAAAKAVAKPFKNVGEAGEWIADNAGQLGKYLAPARRNGKAVVRRLDDAVATASESMGYMLLLASDRKSGRDTVLSDYRCRDIAEKIFDTYKNATGNNRLRSGDDDGAAGRVFVAFIATILHCLAERRLTQAKAKTHSVREALNLLVKIKTLRHANGRVIPLEIPRKTKDIFDILTNKGTHNAK